MAGTGRLETVLRYHAQSTHRPNRYAPGPGFLDWAHQPDPFRSFAGAPRVELPVAGGDLAASWGDLHRPGSVPVRPLDRRSIGALLELALGLTAWKEFRGSRWSLRANPSSGNLHPTEAYLLVGEAHGVAAGLYHYLSRDHVLEQRWTPRDADTPISRLSPGVLVLGLSSIHWREAWKYGERAFRYCQHDVGHALGAVRYAAAVLGWSARLLDVPGDDDVARILGLDRDGDFAALEPADREHPDGLVVVAPGARLEEEARRIESGLDLWRDAASGGAWSGRPNVLSAAHVAWPALEAVATACVKPRTSSSVSPAPSRRSAPAPVRGVDTRAVSLIRQRRSAVAMDGGTGLPAATLFAMLDRLVARPGVPPWDVLPWQPRVHPLLCVHRVEGLAPGLYLLARSPDAHEALRAALRPAFAWERPAGCPEGLHLFGLEEGDARSFAQLASCHQEIASDSAFAVAMLAPLGPALGAGEWWYRWLHWEAGLLGQALYLEAEASGLRATGIGCFFDDVVHEALGLADPRFRDLYHFTVGGGVDDPRLASRPGYDAIVGRRA